MIIEIHYDYTTGTEISFQEGLERMTENISFDTHCLEFFLMHVVSPIEDIRLFNKRYKGYVSVKELKEREECLETFLNTLRTDSMLGKDTVRTIFNKDTINFSFLDF